MTSNVFNQIPAGFFNNLASGSDYENNVGCLLEIYSEFETEVSYRINRKQLRDALATYIFENNLQFSEDEANEKCTDVANAILRKFSDENCGWLTEEIDDTTYEKYIIMTENGIRLAEFLKEIEKPEKIEYSSYIYNIYNTLENEAQWRSDPYVYAIKAVYKNAKSLAKSLKKLSTFIRKEIEKLIEESTLETITNNIIEYCDGDFNREYSRLTKRLNIHFYRTEIKHKLDAILNNIDMHELIIYGCAIEENLTEDAAESFILEMVENIGKFLNEDYDRIMNDIKHKINMHIRIAYGRILFISSNGTDAQGNIEQVLKLLRESIDENNLLEELPEDMMSLYRLNKCEYLDTASLWSPQIRRIIKATTIQNVETLTEEDIEKARLDMERASYNPYSKKNMKLYLEDQMRGRDEITCAELPLSNKKELLSAISAVTYGQENGYDITINDGYIETENTILRDFSIRRKPDGV